MAFLRYVISSSASSSAGSLNNIFNDIRDWVTGSITATSGFNSAYCNIASSEIQGTVPANVYSVYKNTNTTASGDNIIYITKYHSDWSSYNSAHPQDRMHLLWSISSGYNARLRISNKNSGNYMPYPSTAYYHAGNTNNTYLSNFTVAYTTIFIWLEADYMAMQLVDTVSSDAIFIGSFDQPRSEYAEWAFSQDGEFPCAYTISNFNNGSYNNSLVSSYDWFYAGTHDYYTLDGVNVTFPNNYSAGEDFFRGWSNVDNYTVGGIYPNAWETLPQVPISGGVGHQLVPVFSVAAKGNGTTYNYPISGRLKGIYRTSDNFATTGTEVSYGGNTYRVCMMHHCGSSFNDAQNTLNACYLLRVTT